MIFLKDTYGKPYSLNGRRLAQMWRRGSRKVYRAVRLSDLRSILKNSTGSPFVLCSLGTNGYDGKYYVSKSLDRTGKPFLSIGCKVFKGTAYRKIMKALRPK